LDIQAVVVHKGDQVEVDHYNVDVEEGDQVRNWVQHHRKLVLAPYEAKAVVLHSVVEDIAAAANDMQYLSYFRLRASHWYCFRLASFFCLKIVPLAGVMLPLPFCQSSKSDCVFRTEEQSRSTNN
jgi:hypothetical protein